MMGQGIQLWFRAMRNFLRSDHPALHWDRKLKGIFWFFVRAGWVVRVQAVLERHRMGYVGEMLPYLYYMHRIESFVQHGESLERRLQRICNHLEQLPRYFTHAQIRQLFSEGLTIYQSELEGHKLHVVLRYEHGMRHEGLFSLILFIDSAYTYYLHLSLHDGCFLIGGVQGSPGRKDAVRFLTRATGGLRPQNFMLFCLMALAEALDIHCIKGINPAFHALKESERGRHIKFDYLAFWEEMGMDTPPQQPWFSVPVKYPVRPLEEIKAKKRSQYRKRYAFMETVHAQILSRPWSMSS